MRELNVQAITDNIKEMCIEANHFLSEDMKKCLAQSTATEKSALGKKALTRNVNISSPIRCVRELEEELLEKINRLSIGPGGLGGTNMAFAVNVETYPTHIAGLPVGVNICCHVNRHVTREI